MNTNMTGFRWLSKIFTSLCFKQNSLSIVRVKPFMLMSSSGNGHQDQWYFLITLEIRMTLQNICRKLDSDVLIDISPLNLFP